ncbi:uncharacterized protein LOC134183051 [Corticium candelabrum]|uniref:uncharacterized protein LOC134183051 n=1 Tax=Corticium candelabrum TaxID=121492 RepID=UPI002E25F27F|nr:uncharacterized protein LOC134183051 [Corticium candelabrum]
MTSSTIPAQTIAPEDPYADGCFGVHTALSCGRAGGLSVLAALTAIGCVIKLVSLHKNKHDQWPHYVIFYSALIECVIFIIHWLAIYRSQMVFAAEFLAAVQVLVICHFYCSLATLVTFHDNSRFQKIGVPVLLVLLTYFTGVMIWGMVDVQPDDTECTEPHWLIFTVSEFVIIQAFLVAAIYITRKLNGIKTSVEFRRSQQCQLWTLVVALEVSVVTGLVYDSVSESQVGGSNCISLFKTSKSGFTVSYIFLRIFRYLIPIWAICGVFHFRGEKKAPSSENTSSSSHLDLPWIVTEPYVSHFQSDPPTSNKEPLIPP